MKKLHLLPEAIENIETIHQQIALDDPSRADKLVERLLERMDIAAFMPLAWPRTPGCEPDDRYISVDNYVITYRVGPKRVVVTRVFHAARDLVRMAEIGIF